MRTAALGLALATLLAPRLARAGEDGALPLKLTWDAPEKCPTAEDVTRRVQHLLSETPPVGSMVTATARIRPVGDGRFELVLTTEVADARGTKTVGAGTCSALADAAAVFLALAIDSAKDPPPPVPPPPPPPSPSLSPVVVSPAPPERPASGERFRFGGGISGALDVGTLPSASVGLALNLHVRLGRVRFGALGTLWNTQQSIFDEVSAAGASFDMRTGGLFGCYVVPLRQFDLGGCANVEATFASVGGVGIRNPMVARSVWPTAVVGILGGARLTNWLAVVARVDLLMAIGPPEVALATSSGNVNLYDPGVFSARSGLGVEIVLP